MSGVKRMTVPVDADDWARAQRAANQLREVNRELPGMLEAVRRDNQVAIDRASSEVRARQDAVDRALAGLSEQTRKMEARTRQRLAAESARLRGETRAALEEQERRFAEGLERERLEREGETRELRDEVAGIRADRDQALALAQAYVADADVMRDAIARELPHDRFAPGRLAGLSSRLDAARGNGDRGLGEAALVQAQDAYLQLSELRAEVELRHTEWQAARLDAGNAVTLLEQQISLSANPDAVDENGEKIEGYTLDVDFWSEGELSRLREAATGLATRLADEGNPPSAAELRQIAGQAGGELDERLTSILVTAQARQVASQARANLAELVVTTLEETAGYTWEEGHAIYAEDDQRRAFYAKLHHLDDSEIVVEVSPDESGESCTLRILSYDAGLPDEEERVRRAHAVHDSLRAHGLQAGLPAADMEYPDPQLADFDSLRAPTPASRVRATQGAMATEPERA
ncbi:MAG TPA: hypothetical protein VHZ03_51880 [Trebonia sp.]|jgi:hypothetical protein|nr:hypothetical protein [Trebonia sp.]